MPPQFDVQYKAVMGGAMLKKKKKHNILLCLLFLLFFKKLLNACSMLGRGSIVTG